MTDRTSPSPELCTPASTDAAPRPSLQTPRSRPVVLTVGHCGIPTGFARVLNRFTLELRNRFRLTHFAINLPENACPAEWPCPVVGNPCPNDLHKPSALQAVIDSIKPDVVLILDEPWACARLLPACDHHPTVRSICYLAIHGRESLPQDVVSQLSGAHSLVAFTPSAERTLRRALPTSGTVPRLANVPHGVDTTAFYPLATASDGTPSPQRRRIAREILFADNPELSDAFIVLNANRNQPYKGIDRCLQGFARFAKGKPASVRLYLHMSSRPPLPGETLLVDELRIRERLLPLHLPRTHPHADDRWLNLLYNACDVGINTSQREGWGLISFEHAATGAPQIVPNHSSGAELWPGSALLLESEMSAAESKHPFIGEPVRTDSVVEALETLYVDAEERSRLSNAAYHLATSQSFQWSTIGDAWTSLIHAVLES